MSESIIEGRHYLTGAPIRISCSEGRIDAIAPVASLQADRWLAPGLFDVQVNGYGGVDFQRDNLSAEELLEACRALRRDGCSRFFFTLITTEWPRLMKRLKHARRLCAENPEILTSIAGWHVEGPFLSEKPGFCGAHDASAMTNPTPEHVRELRAALGNDPVLLTLAPERDGAIDAIKLAVSLKIKVSLGHTDAPAEVLRSAIEAGATGFTHLANGCPRELDRQDNIVWRVCDTKGLTASLIPDGIHVSAAPFRLFHKLLDTIYYTTDAMAAAGAGPGRYHIGKLEVEVGEDQVVRQPGKTNFAGSALRPIDAIARAAATLQQPWQKCWRRMSETPAAFVGVEHGLSVGAPASLCSIVDGAGGRLTAECL